MATKVRDGRGAGWMSPPDGSLGMASTGRAACDPDGPEGGSGGLLPELFGGRVINDGSGMIKLDASCIAERGLALPLAVEVNWPMILAKALARLYLVADANHEPLVAQLLLIPDIVPPHVSLKVRLEDSGYVRAVVECGDGSLLQVKRWVWVVPSET